MPHKSPWSVSIPAISFPTFLFGSPTQELGDQPHYIDANRPDTHYLTRNAFRTWSQRFALGLQRSGLFQNGDRILVFSSNSFFYPVAFLGSAMAGGIFSGANPSFTARELAYQWKDSQASILLCAEDAIQIGIEAAKIAGMRLGQIFVFNTDLFDDDRSGMSGYLHGCKNWAELFASESEAKHFQWEELTGEHVHKTIALNYSSGTTGLPKGVEVTHMNYIANVLQHIHMAALRDDFEALQQSARWLCFLPLYHAMGQAILMAGSFKRGTPVYIMPKFDFVKMLENVQRFKITELSVVPPIAVALAKHPMVSKYDLSSIRAVGGGAAPLSSDTCRQIEKILGNRFNVKQGYGMTEVTCTATGWNPNEHSESFSVGYPAPNMEMKIMNIDSESYREITERGVSHRGELWCRGPNVMKGYWRNDKATRETLVDDESSSGVKWLRTGDICYVDERGRFYVVDRMKELIKVKGNQVAPAELEALLLEHPDVADVAVIGVATEDGDERPKAYVQRQPGAQVTKEELQKYIADQVVRYKRLAGGIEWLDVIPKNPSGKILRKVLRDKAKEQAKAVGAKL